MPSELLILIFVAVVFLIGATMQRISGMGVGLLGGPALSLIMGPVAGIFVLNVLAAFNAGMTTWTLRRNVEWAQVARIGIPMLLGAIPGAYIVARAPLAFLEILVGALVLLGLSLATFSKNMVAERSMLGSVTSGAAGGFMNTMAGIAGPAITVYAQATRWPHQTFRATLQPLFVISGLMSVAVKQFTLAESPLLEQPWYLWPVGIAALFSGIFLGGKIAPKVPIKTAHRLALTLAAAGALVTLLRGIGRLVL